jgi:hypothetical protein
MLTTFRGVAWAKAQQLWTLVEDMVRYGSSASYLFGIFPIHNGFLTSSAGSFCMKLHTAFPSLNFIVQDKEPVIQQAISVWQAKFPAALSQGKVRLSAHDFFQKNPVQGAEIYWLRHIV